MEGSWSGLYHESESNEPSGIKLEALKDWKSMILDNSFGLPTSFD